MLAAGLIGETWNVLNPNALASLRLLSVSVLAMKNAEYPCAKGFVRQSWK